MKIKSKIYVFITIFALIIANINLSPIKAMTPTWKNNAKFSRGVSNTCYWIHSSASQYVMNVITAASNWMYTGWANPIYMTNVTSNYATHMDIYAKNSLEDSLLDFNTHAYVGFWNINNGRVSTAGQGPTIDYFFTDIRINMLNFPTEKRNLILTHEMGHAFGLSHTGNVNSIMYPDTKGIRVSKVQKADNDAINYLY